ncbi:hypothetical protein [Deinococcus humi]|uniref:hypothetical protein n=1 Tax=Deinococcus humi TaxID=662880 RepID=UPI00198521C2|nr:hypothetical protein [Deinococcus humi]GGO32825.1 hypothetical protein GCM10008949_31040 [Deinococcus humi]
MPATERTKAAQELAKLNGLYAPTKVVVKVTEYSRDWLKQALAVIARYVTPDELRQIAREISKFDYDRVPSIPSSCPGLWSSRGGCLAPSSGPCAASCTASWAFHLKRAAATRSC